MTPTPTATWTAICPLTDIVDWSGVSAIHDGQQVAVFRVGDEVFALSNIDPFSGAGVLSRGIVGDRGGELKVASPLYKQNFRLRDGVCLDDPAVRIPAYSVRLVDGNVEVGAELLKD